MTRRACAPIGGGAPPRGVVLAPLPVPRRRRMDSRWFAHEVHSVDMSSACAYGGRVTSVVRVLVSGRVLLVVAAMTLPACGSDATRVDAGAVDDAAMIVDARLSVVFCDGLDCTTGSAEPYCCRNFSTGFECVAELTCEGGVALACDGYEDCGDEKCCASSGLVTCGTGGGCEPGQAVVCRESTECEGGTECCASPWGGGSGYCAVGPCPAP